MILAELLGLLNLARTQVLCIHETTKVVIIGKNESLVFATFKIMSPYFKSLNNGQKLTVMSFVSSFGKNHFIREVDHQMPSTQVISQLTQHSINSMPRGVSFNPDVSFRIKVLKDR